MSLLPDFEIQKLAQEQELISPFREEQLQPASYDVTLGKKMKHIKQGVGAWIDKYHLPDYVEQEIDQEGKLLMPGEFVLLHTVEIVKLPADVAGKFEGKSSLGRMGLMTHVTAGFIDPGFRGQLTLEVTNVGPTTIRLTPGMRIGQVAFQQLSAVAQRPYGHEKLGSHYQDSKGARGAE